MAWNRALQEIKSRSLEKSYREQLARQKKTDNKKKEHLKKQTQDSQSLALIFSIRRFQQRHFFLKARLAKLKNRFFKFRNRKRKRKLIRQLSDVQETLTDLNKEQKKQTEKHFHSIVKPMTPFKNILDERSALLKKQKEFPLYARQLKFWK